MHTQLRGVIMAPSKSTIAKNCVPRRPALSSRSSRSLRSPTTQNENRKKNTKIHFFNFVHTQLPDIACLQTVFIAPSKGITAGSILNAANEIFNEFTRLSSQSVVSLIRCVFEHKTNAHIRRNYRCALAVHTRECPLLKTQPYRVSVSTMKISYIYGIRWFNLNRNLLSRVHSRANSPCRALHMCPRTHTDTCEPLSLVCGSDSRLSLSRARISRI